MLRMTVTSAAPAELVTEYIRLQKIKEDQINLEIQRIEGTIVHSVKQAVRKVTEAV